MRRHSHFVMAAMSLALATGNREDEAVLIDIKPDDDLDRLERYFTYARLDRDVARVKPRAPAQLVTQLASPEAGYAHSAEPLTKRQKRRLRGKAKP